MKHPVLALSLLTLSFMVLASQASWAQALPQELIPKAAKNAQVTILEFSAPWCLSCKKLKPTVEALQKKMGAKLAVVHLNVDKPESEKYINQFAISSAPTFVVYDRHDKLVEKIERDITPTELEALVTRVSRRP